MHRLIRNALLIAAALTFIAATGADDATRQTGIPVGFVAPAEPQPDDTNAQRAKTQPGNNAPLWRAVRQSGQQPGFSNPPGAEKGVLIQPFVQYPGSRLTNAGEAWRQVRNQWLIPYGGALLLIVLLGVALFHWRLGPLGGQEADTGRVVERFTAFERAAHWTNATAFVVLAVSGITMAFGKFFVLPVIGATLFGGLTYVLKTAHNFVGPLFAVSLVVVFLTFLRDNLPLGSGRFNLGEKFVFWGGVFGLGFVAVASGLVLDKVLPGLEMQRGDMQIAHMIHAVVTLLMMGMFLGHIYLGTIGVKGAYGGMRDGVVDEGWAKEHHSDWLANIKAGKIPAQRSQAVHPKAVHPTEAAARS